MDTSTILKSLDISKWSAITTLIFGGWADLAVLICKAFTNLLRKADAEHLKQYAEFAVKLVKVISLVSDLFIRDAKVKSAALATGKALADFAEHVGDGEYIPEELDADIDNIEAAVKAWKEVAK